MQHTKAVVTLCPTLSPQLAILTSTNSGALNLIKLAWLVGSLRRTWRGAG